MTWIESRDDKALIFRQAVGKKCLKLKYSSAGCVIALKFSVFAYAEVSACECAILESLIVVVFPSGKNRSSCWSALVLNAKSSVKGVCFHAAFYRLSECVRAITYRDSRQRRSASCGHGRDEKPARDGRSWWPFSRGSHACSHGDDCEAGMFFSFFCYLIVCYCL